MKCPTQTLLSELIDGSLGVALEFAGPVAKARRDRRLNWVVERILKGNDYEQGGLKPMYLSRMTNSLSIIAFDPENRQLGGGLLTHTFAACQRIIYIEPGVGVIVSQAASDPFYAFAGLELMRLGKSPEQILDSIIRLGREPERNQVALIDMQGNVAAYTGRGCSAAAGHKTGKHYSCQANIMLKETVWEKMAGAYENGSGELVDRLLDALEAGEQEGGDARGARSALIKVYTADPPQKPWMHLVYDFRIYDHPEPLMELRRLITTQRAHQAARAANGLLAQENPDDEQIALAKEQLNTALSEIRDVECRLEHQVEQAMWLMHLGRTGDGLGILRQVFAVNPNWREVIKEYARANPDELPAQQLDQILAQ